MTMIQDINTHTIPPGGWQFYQPQLNWWAPFPVNNTWDQQRRNIAKVRLNNRAIAIKHNLSTDLDAIGIELLVYTRKRLNIPDPPKSLPRRPLPQVVADAVAAVSRVTGGGALLLEWEESKLPPEPADVSARRASFCVECPRNGKGDFTRWFTIPVSNLLKQRIQRLHQLELKTPYDDQLGVCEACECPLKLKVHTPMQLVLKHLKPEAKSMLWEKCWILNQT